MYLKDVMGTIYLTDEYANDVWYFLSKYYTHRASSTRFSDNIYAYRIKDAINEAVTAGFMELDIKDCRFTGKVWSMLAKIKEHQDAVRLFDSGDEDRDAFIQEYMSFVNDTADLPHVRHLPGKPQDLPALSNWVAGLDRNVVYELIDETYTKNPAFLLTINLLAPEVKMVLNNKEFVDYAKRVFSAYMMEECREFYYIYGNHYEFLEAFADADNVVHVTNIGDFKRETFIRKFPCMPHFVGNERVAFSTASPTLKSAVREIMRDTQLYLDERPTTIGTYFPIKEVYT